MTNRGPDGGFLIDASLLIAAVVREHESHELANRWLTQNDQIALCPIVEGALVRFLVRLGERCETAVEILRRLHAMPGWRVVPDDISYVDVGLTSVRGHRQVTDAYLVGLAVRHGLRVTTLDAGLHSLHPTDSVLVADR